MRGWKRGLSHRPRSKRCPETDALAPLTLPFAAQTSPVAGVRHRRAFHVRLPDDWVSPALPSVSNSRGGGIQWDFVGLHGHFREKLEFPWLFGRTRVGCSGAVLSFLSCG